MLLHGCRSTSPHFWKSGNGRKARATTAPVAAPADPTLLRIRRACSLTSSCVMRPPGPVPCTALMSTPISRERRLTAGDAGAAGPRSPSSLTGAAGCVGASRADRTGIGTMRVGPVAGGAGAGAGAAVGEGAAASGGASGSDAEAGAASDLAGTSDLAGASPDGESTVNTTAPTVTLSPLLTLISLTTPATDDGTSIVALSVSSSTTGWSRAMVSPTLTSTRVTSPEATFSPSSGILNSVTLAPPAVWCHDTPRHRGTETKPDKPHCLCASV